MKRLTKYMIGFVVAVTLLGSAAVAFAAQGNFYQRGPFSEGTCGGFFQDGPRDEGFGGEFFQRGPRGNGIGGEVTAVGDSSLTVQGRNDESVVVNVSDETRIILTESQSEGSLSDIDMGDEVRVRGQRNDDGSVDAQAIMVAPKGDRAGGRVTGVDGQTISVENPRDGEATTIVTDANTQFRLGRAGEGSLTDVTEGKFVMAFGEAQGDSSLTARLVFVAERGPGRGPREGHAAGEVTGVDGSSFTLETFRGDNLTVLTNDDTQYRTRGDQNVSFADIQEGSKVMVKGQPADGQVNTVLAEVIGIKVD